MKLPKPSNRVVQLFAAGGTAVLTFALAASDKWVFAGVTPTLPEEPTFWQLLMSEKTTIGFVRLALVLVALYAVVSVPALIAAGRWLKGFGTTGLSADEATKAEDTIDALKAKVAELTEQRDRLAKLLEA